jgi:drug/metabolite transporter (DMT)-like permease
MKLPKVIFPILTSLLFAGSFVAAKYTTLELTPLVTILLRYILAVAALSLFLMRSGRSSLNIQAGDIWRMALLGLTGTVGYHYFFFSSLYYTKVANCAIINAMNPLITGTMAAIFLKERLSLRGYIGVLIAIIGVLVLLVRGNLNILLGLQFNFGELLMLLAVFCWATYSLLVRSMLDRYSGCTLTFYSAVFGVVLLIPLVVLDGYSWNLFAMSRRSFYSLIYMGIFVSGIGHLFFNLSIREIGPTRTASSVYSLLPIFVAVLALMFFDEAITLIMILSSILIIAGLHFALRESNSKTGQTK